MATDLSGRLSVIRLDELPAERSVRQVAFENWLSEIHSPQCLAEKLAVRDLASARLDLAEAERAYHLRLEYEATVAPQAYEKQLLESYFRLERMLRKDVCAAHEQFSRNLHGARAFARNWQALADDLGPEGVGPSLERAIMAMLAEKQPWKVQELTEAGWQIMGRVLAASTFADELISDWLKSSGLKQSSALGDQIRNRLKAFSDAEQARQELLKIAVAKAETWLGLLDELQLLKEAECRHHAKMAMGIGEKGFTGAMRTARAILKFHNDQVHKREKQLMALQKERLKAENNVKKPSAQRPEPKRTAPAQQSPTHALPGIALPAPVQAAFIQKRTHQPSQRKKSRNQSHAPKPEMQLAGRR